MKCLPYQLVFNRISGPSTVSPCHQGSDPYRRWVSSQPNLGVFSVRPSVLVELGLGVRVEVGEPARYLLQVLQKKKKAWFLWYMLCITIGYSGFKNLSRWWFQILFIFTPNLGEMIQFHEHIFQMGWNHQLVVLEQWWVFSHWLKALLRRRMVGREFPSPSSHATWRIFQKSGCLENLYVNIELYVLK